MYVTTNCGVVDAVMLAIAVAVAIAVVAIATVVFLVHIHAQSRFANCTFSAFLPGSDATVLSGGTVSIRGRMHLVLCYPVWHCVVCPTNSGQQSFALSQSCVSGLIFALGPIFALRCVMHYSTVRLLNYGVLLLPWRYSRWHRRCPLVSLL